MVHLKPAVVPGGSDSAALDNAFELLTMAGRSLPARDDDARPRRLGARRTARRQGARLLPLPRLLHGTVGRAGGGRLHRRHPHRRGPRPQRAAPGPLPGDQRRPGGHGLGGGRAGHRPGADQDLRAARAGPHLLWSTRPRGGSSATTRSRPSWPTPVPTASGWPTTSSTWTTSPGRTSPSGPSRPCRAAWRPSATPARTCGCSSGRWPERRGADRLDGQRRPPRGAVEQAAAPLHLLQAALRPGDQPARSTRSARTW